MSGGAEQRRPARLPIPDAVKTAVHDMRVEGHTHTVIGQKLGISSASVSRILAAKGDPYKRPGKKRCSYDDCERQSVYGPDGYCGMHAYRAKENIPLDAPLMRSPRGTRTPCIFDDCDRPRQSKDGYCNGHARQLRNTGTARPFDARMKQPDECTFPGCNGPAKTHGYCSGHYRQFRDGIELVPLRKPTVWDSCSYSAAHYRCRQLWGRVQQYRCFRCGEPAEEWAYDGKDPTELHAEGFDWNNRKSILPYSRFPEFYMPMCKTCHKRRDMRELHDSYSEFRAWRRSTRSSGDGEPPF